MAVSQLNASSALTTKFTISGVTGSEIDFDYNTMPGNQPNTNANTVFYWQSSSQAIPSSAPLGNGSISGDTPDGSDSIPAEVTESAYVLGYAVGSDVKNICAAAFVPESGGGDPTWVSPSISTWKVGATSVSFNYAVPEGTNPNSDGDWAGLWKGQSEAALYDTPPTWAVQIGQDDPSGQGVFTGKDVKILRGTQYTIGYFKGGWVGAGKAPKQTTLACSVTFMG